jgi:hypothetical protein
MGLVFNFSSSSATASRISASDVKRRLRSAATIHLSASSTPFSAFALSLGLRGLAGTTAKP